jgi:fatty-acyl-CoA synthase
MNKNLKTTGCSSRIASIADIEELERRPYDELVPALSVYDVFANTAALHPDRPALTVLASADPTDVGLALTHRELPGEITRAANLFASVGVGEGDVVSIVAKTHAPVPALIFGAEVAGVVSCLNYMLAPEVLAALPRAEQARVLVCPGPELDAQLWARPQTVIPQVPTSACRFRDGVLPAAAPFRRAGRASCS